MNLFENRSPTPFLHFDGVQIIQCVPVRFGEGLQEGLDQSIVGDFIPSRVAAVVNSLSFCHAPSFASFMIPLCSLSI